MVGWIYCRDNVEACRDIVVAQGSTLGASHQLWQMNEINNLIWPSPSGAGVMDQALWDQTIDIAVAESVLSGPPADDSFTTEYAAAAVDLLEAQDVDVIAPCALGAILNERSIPHLKAAIIAGGANNQLDTGSDGQRLHDAGILYAPDYVINGGGIINVASEYYGDATDDEIWEHWFAPLFKLLDDNKDVIHVLAYINADWDSQAMWGPPYASGFWGDSRLEVNPEIARRFADAIERWKRN